MEMISARVMTIAWDDALDALEALIMTEKCVCCRMRRYLSKVNAYPLSATYPVFEDIQAAHRNLKLVVHTHNIGTAYESCPYMVDTFTDNYGCLCIRGGIGGGNKPTLAADKWTRRELAHAESRVLAALHNNTLLHDFHICNLSYATNPLYADMDEEFRLQQTLQYANILSCVRNLFISDV
jgi:hypothetical protein